jgi:hypothetical protein
MKKKTLCNILIFFLASMPKLILAQAPSLGIAEDFVLFSTAGPVSNTGISQITGDVGTNGGSSTAFGNVNGNMHDNDGKSAQCAADLLTAYNKLKAAIPTKFPAPLLGNGDTLTAGIYSISGNASLNLKLNLDAKGNANSVFIFQIQGAFSANAAAQIALIKGAKACNVFWKIEGLVSLASGVRMKGNIIANNAAIHMSSGSNLEGRALTTAGAITIDGVMAYTPVGCGSVILLGPAAPNPGFGIVTGDIGTNVGLTTGFNHLTVDGTIHPKPDVSTANSAADLLIAYNYVNALAHDIELLYPAQFGSGLVLTPHTYLLDAATTFTDTIFLDARGQPSAVFIIKINGALTTSTYANVALVNGTKPGNVYWMVKGAVLVEDYSKFNGYLICNNGAIKFNTGSTNTGGLYTTNGALNTADIFDSIPTPPCISVDINHKENKSAREIASIYPNPFNNSTQIQLHNIDQFSGSTLCIYDILGTQVVNRVLTKETTKFEMNFPKGMYYYKIIFQNTSVQTGTMISQ